MMREKATVALQHIQVDIVFESQMTLIQLKL